MTSKFHPNEEQLLQFVQGTLSYHEEVFVSAHLHFCADCKREVQAHEEMSSALMQQLDPVEVSDDLLLSLMSRLDDPQPSQKQVQPSHNSELPAFLSKYAPNGFEALKWRRLMPHISVAELEDTPEGYKLQIHKISSGGRVPHHTHRGKEFTVVLQGGFSDALGSYHEGDYLLRDGNDKHAPVVSDDEACYCLTLTEAPVKMTSWKWRWLNPLLS